MPEIPLLPFIAAFIIGLICSPAGVTGAFLLLPFQLSVLGVTSPIANSTNLLYNILSIPGGAYNFWREKRFLLPLAIALVLGYLPGMYLGTLVRIHLLGDVRAFKAFVAAVLLYLGIRLILSKSQRIEGEMKILKSSSLKVEFSFANSIFTFNPLAIALTSFTIGIVASAYGVGGGALMAPILVSLYSLPIKAIAGANLVGTFAVSVFGLASYTALGYPPNLENGIAMGAGGAMGIFIGSKLQGRVEERKLRILLSLLIIGISAKYILESVSLIA
ncbi:sulfite exporter TauE/SafE family protein [Archaeoglobus fulgidus]|uniref:sulfite exporter TauE/SafE family protein n=1 Tax=Archaeoglobus fulgidus TaxID=2234 RepID=UPI000B35CEEF|nr:sulfite exporter TauE/SafE family protein [Archaeoglobus fulgidus]